MRKAGLIAIFALFLFVQPVIARSGCCSHHDGVRADGCGCNDGTPLSSTCAPYYVCSAATDNQPEPTTPPQIVYPTANTLVKKTVTRPTPIPTKTPTPTPSPTPTPTVVPTNTPTPKPQVLSVNEQKEENLWIRFLHWLFGKKK